MRRSAELSVYSPPRSPSITMTQASRFQICERAGNGTRCGTIRVFKKSWGRPNRRRSIDKYAAPVLPTRSRKLTWAATQLVRAKQIQATEKSTGHRNKIRDSKDPSPARETRAFPRIPLRKKGLCDLCDLCGKKLV